MLNDRFTRGFIAGGITGIPIIIYNLLSQYFFETIAYYDFAGTLIYGHRPIMLQERILAFGGVIFFVALLGSVFAMLIPNLQSKNIILKGWVFGCTVWFFSYSVTVLFQIPGLSEIDFKSALSNFLGASLWGVLLAYTISILDKRKIR